MRIFLSFIRFQTTKRQELALRTLELFHFKDPNRYIKFINRVKDFLKVGTDIRIKIAASRALARILKLFVVSTPSSSTDFIGDARISKIIKKMLLTARHPNFDQPQGTKLKYTIYRSLDSDFDGYLIHSSNLELILSSIHQQYPINSEKNRERLLIQEEVMKIIGRLNAANAAETMPQIRYMITKLWDELQLPELEISKPAARLLQVIRRNYNYSTLHGKVVLYKPIKTFLKKPCS